jgi:hypothetical protein
MNKGLKIAGCIIVGVLIFIGFGFITMYLWNWLVPTLFAGPVINFWQTLGLLALSKILFSGFGGKSGGRCGHQHGPWKGGLYNKFSNMTPEEREIFKRKMKDRWCGYEKNSEGDKSATSND